jgi:hypothetical protein
MILALNQDISIFKLKENIIDASEVTRARRELSKKDIIYGGTALQQMLCNRWLEAILNKTLINSIISTSNCQIRMVMLILMPVIFKVL